MEAWLIVLITISAGLVLFSSIMYCKNKKNKRSINGTAASQPVVVVSNGMQNTFIPSTNRAAVYNARNHPNQQIMQVTTGQVYAQQQVYPQQFYPPQQQSVHFQPTIMQTQQFYTASTHHALPQPSVPRR